MTNLDTPPPGMGEQSRPSVSLESQHHNSRDDGLVTASALRVVIVVTGLLGAARGLATANWQSAVEPAQVVAGLVRYSPDSVVGLFHSRLWTVLHQLGALLLNLGVTEVGVSIIFSVVLGAFLMQALGVCTLALSRQVWAAIAAPLVVVATKAYDWGIVYPVLLSDDIHTYGITGIPMMLVIPALVACGRIRVAAFLLGVFPAIHPALGVWCGCVTGLTVLIFGRYYRPYAKAIGVAFVGGCVVTLMSLGAHYSLSAIGSTMEPAEAKKWVQLYVERWDEHRQTFSLTHFGFILAAVNALTALFWLRYRRGRLAVPQQFLLASFCVAFILATVASALLWLPTHYIPRPLLVLMPTRVLNLHIFSLFAVTIGLAASTGRRALVNWIVSGSVLGAIVIHTGVDLEYAPVAGFYLALGCTVAVWFIRGQTPHSPVATAKRWRYFRDIGIGVAAILVCVTPLFGAQRHWRRAFVDRLNEPVLRQASLEDGPLLITADMYLMQLRVRRPVLIDPVAIDALPYVPEAGPMAQRILAELYGHDLLGAPGDVRGRVVSPEINRELWESFSSARWRELASEYGFTNVLTHQGWQLQLPVLLQNRHSVLYRIPSN